MPEKSAFMFHHNFYQNAKIDFRDAEISEETRQKLQTLQQNYDNIASKHSSDLRLTHYEEMMTQIQIWLSSQVTISITFETPQICKRRDCKSIRSRTNRKISKSLCGTHHCSS